MNKILLTGGTGFLGVALLKYWCNVVCEGHVFPHVFVLSRDPSSFLRKNPEFLNHHWLSFHTGNILDPATLPFDESFTQILHAATDSTLGPQLTPRTRFQNIVDGTRNILDLAVKVRAERFLLTSSGAVYGTQTNSLDAMMENQTVHPVINAPRNAYGVGKLVAEHLCALYAEEFGLETIVARCFSFNGPDLPLDVHFAIGNFIRDALWKDEIIVNGDGAPLRSYLDQEDLADWLHVLLQNGRAGETYNVGSDEVVSMAELAHLVRDLVSPEKPVRILSKSPDVQTTRNRYVPNISKAQRELRLDVKVSLAESIRRTAEAHRMSLNQ
ncbi:MAG: NAD(P)-dependent oxidoreductase [Flavobacteriales bacterium]|jgi:UDP-glucuronate decarboxylase|nr:NAD(P)-dependent oxidoreductase [Flavobacteriales bacterium]